MTGAGDWLTDDHHYDIAERVVAALRSLPVEQRMKAMGMVPAKLYGSGMWVPAPEEPPVEVIDWLDRAGDRHVGF